MLSMNERDNCTQQAAVIHVIPVLLAKGRAKVREKEKLFSHALKKILRLINLPYLCMYLVS